MAAHLIETGDALMNRIKASAKLIAFITLFIIPGFFFGMALLDDSSSSEEEPLLGKIAQSDLPTAINISKTGSKSSTPLVVSDSGGNAHVIWLEGIGGKRTVRYNTNKSGAWGSGQVVSHDIKIGGSGPWPDFAIDSANRLHYVLTAVSSFPNYEIFYKQYTDGTWLSSQNISQTAVIGSGGSACPTIGIGPTNNNCYVVWYDDFNAPDQWHLYFTCKQSGKWSNSVSLPVGGGTYTPEIDVDGNGWAHLIWIKRRRTSSTVLYSSNSNPTDPNKWTNPITISGQTNEDWCEPDVAVDDQGNVFVVWMQNNSGNHEIYFRKKSGGSWGSIQNISKTSSASKLPRIAVDRSTGNAYAVWQERAGGKWQIYMNYSAGDAWSTAGALTKNSSDSINPDVYVDKSGEIHIVYADNAVGGYNIWYLSTSEVGGVPVVLYPPLNVHMNTVLENDGNAKKNIIRWKKNPDNNNESIKEYKIYRKKASQGVSAYKVRAKVSKGTSRFDDTGLSKSYKYSYVLTTVNNDGLESDFSNEASEPLVFPPVSLAVKSSLDSTKTKKKNVISWKKNSHNGKNVVKKYKVYRKAENSGTFAAVSTVEGSQDSYTDNDLSTKKKFVYRVTATDKHNRECEPSLSTFEDYVFPPIDLNLKTILNEGLFFSEKMNRLRWKKSPLNDPVNVVKYVIYRKKASENNSSFKPYFVTEGKEFEFWDRSLPQDEKYSYVLTAVCHNDAESKFSGTRTESAQ